MVEQQYFTLSCLKARKWTPTAIKKFLGRPDKCDKNPYWSKGPSMKKYLVSRVEAVEKTTEFKDWFEKTKSGRESRSQNQVEIAERKRKEVFEYIEQLDIKIQKSDERELIEKAGSDSYAVHTIMREEFMELEKEVAKIYGRRGISTEAEIALRHRILDEIAKVYPYLKKACETKKF